MPPRKKSRTTPAAKRGLDFGEPKKSKDDDFVDLTKATASVTPQKKKKRDLHAFFSSPAATTTSEAKTAAAVVTPPEAKKQKVTKAEASEKEEKKEGEYVPIYIHKNVSYVRKGEADLDPATEKAFQLIEEHYLIPKGFENDRSYGPISGISFEERVIASYSNNLLKPKEEAVEICTHCADVGHKRDDCEELIWIWNWWRLLSRNNNKNITTKQQPNPAKENTNAKTIEVVPEINCLRYLGAVVVFENFEVNGTPNLMAIEALATEEEQQPDGG